MRELVFLALLVIILVIVLSSSPLTAAIIIALLANAVVVYYELTRREKMNGESSANMGSDSSANAGADGAASVDTTEAAQPVMKEGDLDGDMANAYGEQHAMYDSYINSYDSAYDIIELPLSIKSASERDLSVDNMAVEISRRRARDKRVMDGIALKDSNFYRHHYAQELEESERKQWWGNNEW